MIPLRCPKFQNSAKVKNITITNIQNSTLNLPFDALSIGHDLHINWICETLCTALWDPFFSHFPSGTFERHFITNAIYVHKLSIQLMYLVLETCNFLVQWVVHSLNICINFIWKLIFLKGKVYNAFFRTLVLQKIHSSVILIFDFVIWDCWSEN